TLTYTDPATGLEVKCIAIAYNDFPTVEWTVYFKNTSDTNTPILEDILALDDVFTKLNGQDFRLHHFKGAPSTSNDYQPYDTLLEPETKKILSAAGGRSTNKDMSYFNLETGDKGVIVVVGWPGQWSATLARDTLNSVNISAGQELTHLRLYPGEEIRSPLMVVQFWQKDWLRSQNIWRRWMLAHNLPRQNGALPEPMMSACSSHQFNEMCNANETNQKLYIDRYVEEQIPLDFWHMDAGWYITGNCWPGTGTWEVETSRFPNGLRAISDHAHANGMDIILWFEPERVTSGTWLTNNHPEWILGGSGGGLLNLGHADAWNWLVNHVDGLINSEGVDLYRQDFNMDPLGYWRGADAADRQGMTEIKHVVGYLAYWDELRRRHPDMLIDTCASGGRRNDLETLRRSVPLLRSDTIFGPVDQQCHTYGIAFWIPYYGSGQRAQDTYTFRSCMLPYNTACWQMLTSELEPNPGINYDFVRQKTTEWRSINQYYLGDYYPLTDYSLSNGDWMAWQFDRPDLGEGMVQAFRRAGAAVSSMILKPRGLDADAWYIVKNLDEAVGSRIYGKDLLIQGIIVNIPSQPGAAVITYQ
ncbi:MAG: alpha-galactosidase, partial [Oligosphaeraceae bacterium]|nr:alpha-galactosidase [Oligosphaeraceae bacterium]